MNAQITKDETSSKLIIVVPDEPSELALLSRQLAVMGNVVLEGEQSFTPEELELMQAITMATNFATLPGALGLYRKLANMTNKHHTELKEYRVDLPGGCRGVSKR